MSLLYARYNYMGYIFLLPSQSAASGKGHEGGSATGVVQVGCWSPRLKFSG